MADLDPKAIKAVIWAASAWLASHDQDALVLEHYNNLFA